ncbi:MAG: zinc ribbon domain-containing protein [Fidelibacterota bacterium]|nr:MAG: zinc ribbon domain-containing protein [Candidatus Neomarinimicrobiota bacterium]
MPVYEYRCRSCDNTFSALVASSDTPVGDVECPRCKEHKAEKLLSMKATVIGGNQVTDSARACPRASRDSGFT